jgi:methyl-accepting chemotaxis protein
MRLNPTNLLRLESFLPASYIALVLVASTLVGGAGYVVARTGLSDSIDQQFKSIAASKQKEFGQSVSRLVGTLQAQSGSSLLAQTALELSYAAIGDAEDTARLKQHFSTDKSVALRIERDGSNSGMIYGHAHALLHRGLRTIVGANGIEDVLLISPQGQVIYTATKAGDFLEHVSAPKLASTGLARLVKELQASTQATPRFEDFAPYPFNQEAPQAFIGAPIGLAGGAAAARDKVGFLVLRISIDAFKEVLATDLLPGRTGRVWLSGQDNLLRSPLLTSARRMLTEAPFSAASRDSVADGVIRTVYADRGTERLAAVAPVGILGSQWRLVADQEREEAFQAVSRMGLIMAIATAVVLLIVGALAFAFARSISRPLASLAGAVNGLAAGRSDVVIPESKMRLATSPARLAFFGKAFLSAVSCARSLMRRRLPSFDGSSMSNA